jgi:hypothetical protein
MYFPLNIIRKVKVTMVIFTGHAERMGEVQNKCRDFVGKPERKRPLLRFRCI